MNFPKIILIYIFISINLLANQNEKVSIQLDWLHQFQFAGYYMAKEKGFFEKENLDVEIKEFNFNINLLEDVLISKSEYAVGKSSLIIDRLEGKKITLLSAIYQNSPMILITLKKSNINTPFELKDKKVMLTPDARSAASINAMIISQGLKLNEINFQPHSFKLNDLINGTTDAMGCYISNEPYLLSQKKIEYNIHNPSDYGFNFYGGIFFTSNKELNNNPIRVRKMYKAILKGWEYAFNNIEETAQLIFNKYNTQNKTLNSLIFEGKELKKLAEFDKGFLGNIDLKKIEEMKRLYLLLALTKNDPTLETKDFIYNPNNINYTKDEKKYLENNKIILMTNDFSPPYTMKNKDKIEGIEIDYWKLINKKLKIKNINLKKIKRNTAFIKEIKNNKNLVKYTYNKKGLNENLKATNPITTIKIGLATQNDKAYLSNFSELNNKKIAIVKFSKIYQTFKTKYPKIKFITVKNLKEGFNLIKEKKVFGLIGKIPALSYHISNNRIANIKISGTFEEKFELKLLVDSSNEALLKLLNEAISIITDEEKNNIHSKYYSVILQTKTDYTWLYKVVLPLIAIIIFIILTNRKLNKEIKNRKEIELQLHKVANIDALTNIYNRRKIETLYNSEVKRVKRYKRELSIIFFDVDNFKLINDQLGHATGDYVLVKLASIIKNNIRSIDYFGRWGGEEFIIILAETNKEKAGNIAHVLKNKINQSDFNIDREVTCSFGVSQFEETDSADSLLTRADHAMYYIKRNGKNSVKIA